MCEATRTRYRPSLGAVELPGQLLIVSKHHSQLTIDGRAFFLSNNYDGPLWLIS